MKATASNCDARGSEQRRRRLNALHSVVEVRICSAVNRILSASVFNQATRAAAEVYLIVVDHQ